MIRISLFILLVGLHSGCASPHPHPEMSPETQSAMGRLRVGMKESEAVAIMRPVSLDWGHVYYGGTGAGRLYFQVSSAQQLWLDSGGSFSNWRVTNIGVLEPKTEWRHFGGESIVVRP